MKKVEFNRLMAIVGLASILLSTKTIVLAQGYAVDWFTVGGGGGTISNGAYSVSGTIGQSDCGLSSGGSYGLQAGFWSVTVALQAEGMPLLTISHSGSGVVISWPEGFAGFILESTSTLTEPGSWQSVTGVSNNSIVLSASPGSHFYRLRRP
jgi:hypothetical protein